MKIFGVIDLELNLDKGHVIVEVGTDLMWAEERVAQISKTFLWEWNKEETRRVVTGIYISSAFDVTFNENQGNKALLAVYANKLVTEDYIEGLIN